MATNDYGSLWFAFNAFSTGTTSYQFILQKRNGSDGLLTIWTFQRVQFRDRNIKKERARKEYADHQFIGNAIKHLSGNNYKDHYENEPH